MNLASPAAVREILERLGVHPSRKLGQSFLIDGNILRILADAAELTPKDQVLEVGPGLGVVTEELLARCGRVVAVEMDARLHAHLAGTLGGRAGLELVRADMLDVDANALFASGVNVVVSNLPYSSGSRILAEFFAAERPPERMVVTVQKEVGERLAAATGTRDYGLLSVWAQLLYEVRRVKTVSPSCFWPRPEVGSAVVRFSRRGTPLPGAAERKAVRGITRLAFQHRRKQLAPTFGRDPAFHRPVAEVAALLESVGARAQARPEDLSPDQWLDLARLLGAGSTRTETLR